METALKRALMFAYCHGLVSAAVVGWLFQRFDLQGK